MFMGNLCFGAINVLLDKGAWYPFLQAPTFCFQNGRASRKSRMNGNGTDAKSLF